MEEFKERVFRRREAERAKNQQAIDALKQELEDIKLNYQNESKRIEEQFSAFRASQKEKSKAKAEQIKADFELKLEAEKIINAQLQSKIEHLESLISSKDMHHLTEDKQGRELESELS